MVVGPGCSGSGIAGLVCAGRAAGSPGICNAPKPLQLPTLLRQALIVMAMAMALMLLMPPRVQADLCALLRPYGIQCEVVDRYIVTQSRQAVSVEDPVALVRHLETLIGTADYEALLQVRAAGTSLPGSTAAVPSG